MEIEVKRIAEEDLDSMEIKSWPIWTKEESEFDWHYEDKEQCYFLEGKVMVITDKQQVEIKIGDFAVFPKGMNCVWKVIEPVKKHYKFG